VIGTCHRISIVLVRAPPEVEVKVVALQSHAMEKVVKAMAIRTHVVKMVALKKKEAWKTDDAWNEPAW
jgi:hypothetical protein